MRKRTPAPRVLRSLSRRQFLKASGMAAVLANLPIGWTGRVFAADAPEKPKLTIGIIPLTDCAQIVVAHEKGFFKEEGLDVTVAKEISWAAIRDKVTYGDLDAAHMLAPMPLAATLGVGSIQKDTVTAMGMDLNGNGITVSNAVWQAMNEIDPASCALRPTPATALKKLIERDRGKRLYKFAMVFPVATHNYEIRYWLASAGIDPDNDIKLDVIPPPQMVANLRAGNIDGYCVGEPWNQRAVSDKVGVPVITNVEIFPGKLEKVVGVNREWMEKYPHTHRAMLRALIRAGQWADPAENRLQVVQWISQRQYVNAPEDVVKNSMTGTFEYAPGDVRQLPDFNVFFRQHATFPWRSFAVWFLTQMQRWGQLPHELTPADYKRIAEQVYLTEAYREAAKDVGVTAPDVDYKKEADFFDSVAFDPDKPIEYINQFPIRRTHL
ncbi:MAG: ABC transporter substrate-binding protein [Candidatus Binatia bacterium]